MGCQEKYIPCGIVDEDSGQLHISFGSSYKTSDFIVDTLEDWWSGLSSATPVKVVGISVVFDPVIVPSRHEDDAPEPWLAAAVSSCP